MQIEQQVRDTKQQEYLASLHKAQWEKHERRVTRWDRKRFELEQQQRQNNQHEDLVSQHDDAASQHNEIASQHDDADSQQEDEASQQDETMNDNDDEPADEDLPGDRAPVSGWDTNEANDILSSMQGAYGRRHSHGRRHGVYGGRGGRGSVRIHFERPEYEGSSSTGEVYMSGALQGGYGRGRGSGQNGGGVGRAGGGADDEWVQLDV